VRSFVVVVPPATAQYESAQLQNQLGEIDEQLRIISEQVLETARAANDRVALVESLTVEIDSRTASRITPRLQAYADATAGAVPCHEIEVVAFGKRREENLDRDPIRLVQLLGGVRLANAPLGLLGNHSNVGKRSC
jgi:hypothetical protein